uniref:Uncharacterized protein n=1 Tax=Caenorhabditis japonica TaxID=281687 RepID=A0A8R1HUU4_CAEJA
MNVGAYLLPRAVEGGAAHGWMNECRAEKKMDEQKKMSSGQEGQKEPRLAQIKSNSSEKKPENGKGRGGGGGGAEEEEEERGWTKKKEKDRQSNSQPSNEDVGMPRTVHR